MFDTFKFEFDMFNFFGVMTSQSWSSLEKGDEGSYRPKWRKVLCLKKLKKSCVAQA